MQNPFVRRYADEVTCNQQQTEGFRIGTYATLDDKNEAAVMARGPNTSYDYNRGVNFVDYQFGPIGSINSASRMWGYVAGEPTWVNDRPVAGKVPRIF